MKAEQRSREFFKGKTVHIGIDVHAKSYQVRPLYEGKHLGRSVRLSASAKVLLNWAERQYPGATLVFGYEAGFSGLSLSRRLIQAGHQCHVLNAADIPSTEKDRVYKNDQRDSKKIAYALVSPYTDYVHQISPQHEVLRQNVRGGLRLNQDVSRLKSRIKQHLYYLGLSLPCTPKGAPSWSKASRAQLRQQAEAGTHLALGLWLDQLEGLLSTKGSMWQRIDQLLLDSCLCQPYELLQTASGIGPVLGATLVSEIYEMRRFESMDQLRSYVGLTPKEASSGQTIRHGRMSKRGNKYLRWAILQAARRSIDRDTELAMRYAQWRRSCGHEHKAIVKVANLLLGRLRAMWLTGQPYRRPHHG